MPESKQEHHVFISYAHLDNKPLPTSAKGWVSYFDEALTNLLSQQIGKEAKVWRDPQMERNAIFNEEIFNNLLQSRTLVSVVSPRYIESDYCLDELEKFLEKKPAIGSKSPVFKVVKTFLELDEMPEIFRDVNGFYFYTIDEETKRPRELRLEYGETFKQEFFLRVSDLAYEIAKLLETMDKAQPQAPAQNVVEPKPIASSNLPGIYLAKSSGDFQKERDNIRRDLLDRGYEVFPPVDTVEPTTTEEYKNFVRENMQKCALSVHLIGKNYGERPEDGDQSYIHLQTLVAAERAQEARLKRIVWVPKDVNLTKQNQVDFITEIWDSTASGVEVLEKPLEDLKTNILDVLEKAAKPQSSVKTVTAKPSVLILYDKSDAADAAAVEAFIKERGCSVWSAAKYLSGESSKLIEAQNEYLRNCDAVLIYWNNSPDFWMRIMLQRLQKILGDGREESFLGEAVFMAGDNSADDLSDETEAEFLDSFDELAAFLEEVKTAFSGKS